MFIDLTVKVSREAGKGAAGNERMVTFGHLGTHFDVMNKEFPLKFLKLPAHIFDVSKIFGRDITSDDLDMDCINENTFVAFYTGYIEKTDYGTQEYFTSHPQLSGELIDKLISKSISIIGIDSAGIRRGKEHTPMDQYCADNGVFVVENLCNLNKVLQKMIHINHETNELILSNQEGLFVYTFPVNFTGMSGLPCRVVAELIK